MITNIYDAVWRVVNPARRYRSTLNVTGPVTAKNRLVVGRAGSLVGDVRVARLVVEDGATFSGKVSMGKQLEAPPKPAEPLAPEPVVTPTKAPETKAKRR